MIQKTCLYDNHVKHNAKIVEFGGFLMPLEYTDITSEHLAVRNDAGVFDCSHMGEILVTGKDTLSFLNYLVTCNVKEAKAMKMTYGLLLYENGTVVDDLMVYKINDEKCMLVVNASNTDKDYEYILANKKDYDVKIENQSNDYGQLALQGPSSLSQLQKLTSYNLSELKYSYFDYIKLDGKDFIISRSGYTGSDGFEIYGSPIDIIELFEKLYNNGVQLCGLGCRDTLRFEAAMPLYGHEINDQVTPLEAGLSFGVSLEKGDFIGRDVLLKQKEQGLTKKLVGIELLERGIARGGYELYKDDEKIGEITTGYMIPNTNKVYALGYVKIEYSKIGEEISVLIRNRKVKAKIRNKKFLNKEYAR
ncbi:MAG: glycine cleavage system aminomethyltransferase GcvT [Bacilli bacterium]|nr:glycine cleavage system aminomethyltransferase GcvT [Bacilli bacterium]